MMTELYSANAISERVEDIADDLNRAFKGAKVVHAVVTLNGAFMFAADLVRHLDLPLVMHFAGEQSYLGTQQGEMRINVNALPRSFNNEPVLVIEDIMDTGNTADILRGMIAERQSGQIKIAALLKRQGGDGAADYHAFTLPRGLFVVGYGMDMDGRYRELSNIYTMTSIMGEAGNAGVC